MRPPTKSRTYGEKAHGTRRLGYPLAIPVATRRPRCRRWRDGSQQAKAWDLWLDCASYREIGVALGVAHDGRRLVCSESRICGFTPR